MVAVAQGAFAVLPGQEVIAGLEGRAAGDGGAGATGQLGGMGLRGRARLAGEPFVMHELPERYRHDASRLRMG